MVEDRRDQDSENDRHRRAEPRRQQDSEKLRLVAQLGEGDDTRGNQKRFHDQGDATAAMGRARRR